MPRKPLLASLAAAALLAAAPLGLADSGSFPDPRGDLDPTGARKPSSSHDLVRATQAHSKRRLVHTVTVAGDAPNPAAAPVPVIWIEVPDEPNGTSQCRYFVGRQDGRLGVFTCGYAERVGSARIRRTSPSTVRYEFSPRAIGNPGRYFWAVASYGPAENTQGDIDRLPDDDHARITHVLR